MKRVRKILSLVFVMLFVLMCSNFVYALDGVEMDRLGSISITMHIGDQRVSGGTLSIYRVGAVCVDNGRYYFKATGDFIDCGESFDNLESVNLVDSLSSYVSEHSLSGVTKEINDDGEVVFDDLEVGLYFLEQNQVASGYERLEPFLVSIPYESENGEYSYDVDASPKVVLKRVNDLVVDESGDNLNFMLPQTGQLNWPIPVFAIIGLFLFVFGLILRRKTK